MPSFSPIQTAFSAGVLSPRLRGRVDAPIYKKGLARCENWIPTPQGSLLKRAGAEVIAPNSVAWTRLLPFKSAELGRFQVALLNLGLQIYDAAGVLQSAATELISNPDCNPSGGVWTFTTGGLFAGYYGTAPNYSLGLSSMTWAQQQVTSVPAGTYNLSFDLKLMEGANTRLEVKIGTTAGGTEVASVNYTATGTHVFSFSLGSTTTIYVRFLLYQSGPRTGWALVDDVSLRTTTGTGTIVTPWTDAQIPEIQYVCETGRERMILVHPSVQPYVLTRSLSTGVWTLSPMFSGVGSLGGVVPKQAPLHTVDEWSSSTWPAVVDIWQGRLWLASITGKKNTFWASKPGTYDFTAVDYNALTANDGFTYDIAMKGEIRWLQGQKVMLVGGDEGEYSISANDGIVYAGNIDIKQESAFGSAKMQALSIGDQVVYVSADRRKVRAMSFSLEGGGWFSRDLTFPAEHLTKTTVFDMVFCPDPHNTLVCLLEDGTLACCNYDRLEETAGWWTANIATGPLSSISPLWSGAGSEVWGIITTPLDRKFIVRMPFYEPGRPSLDMNRAVQSSPIPITGTMAYDSGTGVLTASAAGILQDWGVVPYGFLSAAVPGMRFMVMGPTGYVEYEYVSWVSDYSAQVTRVGGVVYSGSISATTDWYCSTSLLQTANWPRGQVSVPYIAEGESVSVYDSVAGTYVTAEASFGGLIIIDRASNLDAQTFVVGTNFNAIAETLPLDEGNPAGSAQGFKSHRVDLVVRLNDSALPVVEWRPWPITTQPAAQRAYPERRIGQALPSPYTRVTEDAAAKALGYGGVAYLVQDLPERTEICALFGNTQQNQV